MSSYGTQVNPQHAVSNSTSNLHIFDTLSILEICIDLNTRFEKLGNQVADSNTLLSRLVGDSICIRIPATPYMRRLDLLHSIQTQGGPIECQRAVDTGLKEAWGHLSHIYNNLIYHIMRINTIIPLGRLASLHLRSTRFNPSRILIKAVA